MVSTAWPARPSSSPQLTVDASPRRDREDMKQCWKFLDATSRSFAAVIKELEGDLSRVVRLTPDGVGGEREC
mgnify:FL=1